MAAGGGDGDFGAKTLLNLLRRFARVDDFEMKLFRHLVEFFDQERLIFLEAVIEIRA